MAKVELNPVLEQVHGQIGDLVFKKYNDEVVISRKAAPSNKPPSAAQEAQRKQFKEATLYGRAVLADPQAKAVYESGAKGVTAFALAIGDYLNAPVVDKIDLSAYTGKTGETIRVMASDDFEVVGVTVSVTDANGVVLENGPATAQNGWWHYTTATDMAPGQPVSIVATAMDRPGNKSTKTQAKN